MSVQYGVKRKKRRLFEGGVHFWLEKLFDALALNLVWLLCCVPLVTAGAATAAFYYTAVKVLRKERGKLFAEFFTSFKINFAKGTALTLVFGALLFIIGTNINIARDANVTGGGYFGLFLVCFYVFLAALLLAVFGYALALLSRFDMPLLWLCRLSVFMTFRYAPATAVFLVSAAAAGALVYYAPLFVFILPVGLVMMLSYLMEKLLLRHTPLPADGGGEKWYLET